MESSNANDPSSGDDADAADLDAVGAYASARRAHEAGLAVLACGQPYWVRETQGRYLLLVRRSQAGRLRREVALVEASNRYWPPRPAEPPPWGEASARPVIGASAWLVALHLLQRHHPGLVEVGLNDSRKVLESGEAWRLLTAVTLHADLAHLAGNLLGLGLFAYLPARYLGSGLAWTVLLLCAGAANLANDLLHAPEAFRSLGASTVVFAGLGLLAGYPVGASLRARASLRAKPFLLPLAGGAALFAWMGGGRYGADVAGHLWSAFLGLAAGGALAWAKVRPAARIQRLLLAGCAAAVAGAWLLALFRGAV